MSVKKIENDLFLRAAKGEIVERPPVWLMRQAGRVLPEYRATRAKSKNFIEFVKNPELAAEVTIQPVDILGVDAAIIFSDILVIPEAMGLPYQMIESKGPWFENTITSLADVERLHICDGSELKYVTDAIALAKQQLNNRVPLIGFAGAPFTILAYMVEGSGSKTFSKAKAFLYQQPAAAHLLLEKIALSTIQYLKAQISAGADLIQLFDSWAGVLSPDMYSEFSLKYISMICDAINEVPKTVFAKGANFALSEMSHLNCEVLGLDWNIKPVDARALVGSKVLQGNADPCLLYANEEKIVFETHAMLKAFGKQKYIANLGHGLYPDIEKEKVKLYVDTIKNYKYN
jgi:uroporphyrinogen decarboxylase